MYFCTCFYMSQNDRILALLNAHYQGDDEQFNTVALQLAAVEARLGHSVLAQEIRKLFVRKRYKFVALMLTTPVTAFIYN